MQLVILSFIGKTVLCTVGVGLDAGNAAAVSFQGEQWV